MRNFFLIFNFARVDALSFWLVDEKKWKRMRKYMFFSSQIHGFKLKIFALLC